MEQKKIYAMGMDVYSEFSSVSYLEKPGAEIQSLGLGEENGKYVIPMTLYKRKTTGDWLIGDEAVFASENEEGGSEELVLSVYDLWLDGQKKYVQGQEYEGSELFTIYLQVLFGKVQEILGFSKVERLVVTAEELDRSFVAGVQEIFANPDMAVDRLQFITHREAFAYYVLGCKKELWANDVTLFHLDKRHFVCQNFTRRKEKEKNTVVVREEDLTDMISYEMLKNPVSAQVADDKFCQYLREDYQSHIVSCVLFTGVGFYEDWYQKSIGEICKKRRAFKGFNLYAEGACQSVLLEENPNVKVYCDGRTQFEIGIFTDNDSMQEVYKLSDAAVNWTEAKGQAEFILDDTEWIDLSIRLPFQKETERLRIELSELPLRKDKTMCVEVRLEYEDSQSFILTVKDMGFGDLFPSSGAVLKRKISLQ